MALGIPMPQTSGDSLLKGLNTGSTLFSRYMEPILQRQRMAQQQQQFGANLGQRQSEQQQAEQHFLQELALRKQQEARLAQASAIQQQMAQLQMQNLRNKLDPTYEFKQFQELQKMFGGGSSQQQEIPIQEIGQGMGAFSPETITSLKQPDNSSGINLSTLKQNPLLRGFFKQKFGYDPLNMPQTPEEKQAMAIDLFKKKEDIKNQNKSGSTATNKVLTQNQQAIQAIDTVLPQIDELITNPESVYGQYDFSPSKKAAYYAKTGGMIDQLVAAQSLPQVQASIDLVEQQIRRATNETNKEYNKRLRDFRKDLLARREKAQKVVESNKVDTSNVPGDIVESKVLDGVKYEKINGEWHVAD